LAESKNGQWRASTLLKAGNKDDRTDARKLADLLRSGLLSPVYHGGAGGVRTLKELARSYLTITKDLTRVMNRIKGLYRSWPLCWAKGVFAAVPQCMVAESDGGWGTAPGGVVVSTTG
jgi:Transposase